MTRWLFQLLPVTCAALLCLTAAIAFVGVHSSAAWADIGGVRVFFSAFFGGVLPEESAVQRTEYISEEASFSLEVENILQNPSLPNGCEAVSLAIAPCYAGYETDAEVLYECFMPKAQLGRGDPWTAYVGDARGAGLGCYAPCVVKTGNAFLSSIGASAEVCDVSGRELKYYKELLREGTPVIMWGTVDMCGDDEICYRLEGGGESQVWHTRSHCLVLVGYTEDTYIFCDPLVGAVEYGCAAVERSFELNFRQACIVRETER